MYDHFIPLNSTAYSPEGIRNWLEKTISEEGDFEKVRNNKHKNKNLLELRDASFLALAFNKLHNRKFYLYPADNSGDAWAPDVLFLDQERGEAFPVEVMELLYYDEDFDGDYKKLAQKVWNKKGKITDDKCNLLITLKMSIEEFNVSKFTAEMSGFDWKIETVWFVIYSKDLLNWTYFELFPNINDIPLMSFSCEDKDDMKFYY